MCQSIAEGGLRCAAHARKKFEAATVGTREWDDAAADYAATREGHDALDDMRFRARMACHFDLEAACQNAIRRGNNRRLAGAATSHAVSAQHEPLTA